MYARASRNIVQVSADAVMRPVAKLTSRAGSLLSGCANLPLDASASYGGGGRPLYYEWALASIVGGAVVGGGAVALS